MKKKILALVLVVVLALTAITGTLAYFTDTEHATNTFTVGSVDIQLLESQYYTNVDKDKTDDNIREDAKEYDEYLAEQGKDVVPGREFMKAIYIDNTGINNAYVRVRMIVTRNQFESFYFTDNTTAMESGKIVKNIVAHYADGTTKDYSSDIDEKGTMKWDNVKKDTEWTKLEYIYTYTEVLAAGDLTAISPVWKFQMKNTLDNEDVNDFTADDLKIEVYADAIQAEGFESAKDAFAVFNTQETASPTDGTPDKTDTPEANWNSQFGATNPTNP